MEKIIAHFKANLWLVLATLILSALVKPLVDFTKAIWISAALFILALLFSPWFAVSALSLLVNSLFGGILKKLG